MVGKVVSEILLTHASVSLPHGLGMCCTLNEYAAAFNTQVVW